MQLQEAVELFASSSATLQEMQKCLSLFSGAPLSAPANSALLHRLKASLKRLPGVELYLRRRYEKAFAELPQANLFRGIFASFPDALHSAPPTKSLGYDHEAPATMYRDLLSEVFPRDYPALLWIAHLLSETNSLFDFGGHIGVSYYSFQQFIKFPMGLRWRVWDVPAVIQQGNALAGEKQESRLSFTNEISDADGFDIFYAGGSLQYSEATLTQLLSKLRAKPKHLLIAKLPMTDAKACVTLQSIGTAFCPYRIFNRAEFMQELAQLGYALVDQWITPELCCEIPFHSDYHRIPYAGFYFRLA